MAKKKKEAWEKQAEKIWKTLDKVSKEQEEFAKEMRQLRKSQQKTDQQIKQTQQEIQQLREAQAETNKQIKEAQAETNKQMRETDKKIDKISKDIGGGLGRMAEGLTAPCVPELFKQYGMNITSIYQRVKALDNNKRVIAEVDIIGVGTLNGKKVFLVGEVKAHLTSDDVKDFIDEVLPYFRKHYSKDFKELENKETYVYGFVSGIFIDESARKFANRKGLYILEPKGETMHIVNPLAFKPKLW